MDEQGMRQLIEGMLPRGGSAQEYERLFEAGDRLRHPDYVLEMPQSGERIRGREHVRAMQEAYPDPPAMRLRRVIGRDDLWVVELVSDYGGRSVHVLLVLELRDDLISRETRYYAEPFEAPAWRAALVERFDGTAAVPSSSPHAGEGMSEQQMRELLSERLAHLSAEEEYELRHPEFVMEMPQSGERVVGRDNMRAFQREFPSTVPCRCSRCAG
jgi:hypothetical protein